MGRFCLSWRSCGKLEAIFLGEDLIALAVQVNKLDPAMVVVGGRVSWRGLVHVSWVGLMQPWWWSVLLRQRRTATRVLRPIAWTYTRNLIVAIELYRSHVQLPIVGYPCIFSDHLQYRPYRMDRSTAIWYGIGTASWCASLSIKPMSETHVGGIAAVLKTVGVVQCSRV